MTEDKLPIGADIGGTHITAALVNPVNRQVIQSSLTRLTINEQSGVDELIAWWSVCIKQAAGLNEISKICLAMPGPFNYEEGICLINNQNKYPGLYGVNVLERLAAALDVPVSLLYMRNDAGCFLQGELFAAKLDGVASAIGVTLGTGLGTAVYKNGEASSADLWNTPFHESIAEDYISSGWFTRRYHALTGVEATGVKQLAAIYENDDVVRTLFAEFGNNLGLFLNTFIGIHEPELIIIGGNISNAWSLFEEEMMSEIFNHHPGIKIRKSEHGEKAALIGAVAGWFTN
jgi:glucokinase